MDSSNTHYPEIAWMTRCALKHAGGRYHIAARLVQDTQITLLDHEARTGRPLAPPARRQFAATTLRRLAIDRARSPWVRLFEVAHHGATTLPLVADTAPTPPSVAASREEEVRVRAAIEALPLELREVFRLYYEERLSQRAVAFELGVSSGQVSNLLKRLQDCVLIHLQRRMS